MPKFGAGRLRVLCLALTQKEREVSVIKKITVQRVSWEQVLVRLQKKITCAVSLLKVYCSVLLFAVPDVSQKVVFIYGISYHGDWYEMPLKE